MATPGRWARLKGRAKNALAGVGLLTVGAVALQVSASRRRLRAGMPEEGFILELDLEQNWVVEYEKTRPLAALLGQGGRGTLQLSKVTEALRAAGSDGRVKGLLALIGTAEGGMGFAQAQELRGAVAEFRQRAGARAPTLAYSDAFGEAGGGGTGAYYLATAFEFIALQPSGMLSATGLAATSTYARGFLDRWRVKPYFFAREEYKSAASFIINRASTKHEREAMRSTLQSLSGQVVAGIAAARGLTTKQVHAAIDSAPHLAQHAEQLRLVDALLYRDQALKLLARLHEARNAGSTPQEGAAAEMPAAEGAEARPAPLLQRLLAEPEAAPAKQLKHVSVARYAASLEEQRRVQESGQWQADALAGVRRLWGTALQVSGWSLMLQQLGLIQTEAARKEAHLAEAAAGGLGLADAASSTQQQGQQQREEKQEAARGKAEGQQQSQQQQPSHVALLTLTGPIYLGPGPSSPIPGGPAAARDPSAKIASLPVIKSLREARENDDVKAVVLRVDSPGGSAAASDAIHREVSLLRQAGKPVVVSMGNAAASGGYFIACAASKIVAQPGTITGSIGVLSGKLVFDDALREYGITTETLKTARNADAMSPFSGFDKEQRRKVEEMMDSVYTHFKERVSEGRGLSAEAVAKLARGRVWTGEQALELGLVDQLGGLDAAILLAKQEAGLPEEEGAVPVKQVFPERKSPLAQVVKALSGGSDDSDSKGSSSGSAGGGGGSELGSAAWEGAAVLAAAALGRQLTGAEWALLVQQQQQKQLGSMVGPQCLALDAERLATAL